MARNWQIVSGNTVPYTSADMKPRLPEAGVSGLPNFLYVHAKLRLLSFIQLLLGAVG